MTNHPNRGRKDAPPPPFHLPRWLKDRERGKSPSPEQMRKLRQMTGLTKPETAERLHVSLRTYEEWEAGRTAMHPNHWLAMRCACAEHARQTAAIVREIRDERDGIAAASE